jgi:hypothetical protein
VFEQISDPFTILHIRLSPRDSFDVSSIDQDDLQRALQNIEYGLPVNARALDCHMGASF